MNTHEHNAFPVVTEGQIGEGVVQTVNARDLHAFLRVGKDFSNWIKDRIDQYGFTENVDYVVFAEIGENSRGGRPAKEYALTLDMAKELSMVERNEQGKKARQYFIECERVAKDKTDPLKVLNDPEAMRGLLLSYSEKVLSLESRIEADRPKTEFYDAYLNADGLYGLQNAARALNCRPNLFIRWLKENYLFYQGGNLVARIQHIQAGHFEVKTTIVDDKVRPQAFVTPKGLKYLDARVPDHIRAAVA
ncbi:MAG: antA/AntB antirepressor family protein [Rhizobiaceae bacterium]|nr:antA/AntB antirepressor family protein [Rhizobiaceae bacterium]